MVRPILCCLAKVPYSYRGLVSVITIIIFAHRAGTLQEALWETGEMVVDDLEAIANDRPPRALQQAEPELAPRYTSNRAAGGRGKAVRSGRVAVRNRA